MRVIAGTHRGRRLLGPAGKTTTRPITDRVKQSLFDRLWSSGALETGAVLDLFSGTGSLGIEALSRGVDRGFFVEADRSAAGLLEQNLKTLGLTDQASVFRIDATASGYLGRVADSGVGLVFCDPPYALNTDQQGLTKLVRTLEQLCALVEPEAVMIFRTPEKTPGPEINGWRPPETFAYGSMWVHWYVRA